PDTDPLPLHDALPISTRIAERPVTTAFEPKTRTSRASGVIDAYRKAPLPTICSNSALVFRAPSVWVYVNTRAELLQIVGSGALRDRKSTRLNSSHQII